MGNEGIMISTSDFDGLLSMDSLNDVKIFCKNYEF